MTLAQRAAVALVACGALVAPSAAWATHMPGTNGMACPHASGEGTGALPPTDTPTIERAPAAPVGSTSSSPAPERPATPAPGSSAPANEAAPVTQPVTTTTSTPATTTVATPVATAATATATAPVQARERADRPRRHRARPEVKPPVPKHFGPVMQVGRPAPVGADATAADRTGTRAAAEAPAPDGFTPPALLLGLGGLALAGAAFAVRRRRRGDGGVVAAVAPATPPAPAYADPAVDAELHEIIAEAKARELLGDEREPAGTR
jgi:hypothetical protein